jgi:hypothetical protein
MAIYIIYGYIRTDLDRFGVFNLCSAEAAVKLVLSLVVSGGGRGFTRGSRRSLEASQAVSSA